jgi:hypothetical protein
LKHSVTLVGMPSSANRAHTLIPSRVIGENDGGVPAMVATPPLALHPVGVGGDHLGGHRAGTIYRSRPLVAVRAAFPGDQRRLVVTPSRIPTMRPR